ncbi:MAG: putative colanic acid biosynthesis acetyltransferase [Planctomycetota bacterium]|nr:putative colanic acid biosynthesis acetyltransferase [Planctomycetota bacterium]
MTSTAEQAARSTDAAPRAEDRGRSPYSRNEKIARMLWALVQATVFRASFTTWYGFRVWLINRFGARVTPGCRIRRTVRIECPWNLQMGENCSVGDGAIIYCLGPVRIGDRVSISQHAHICAGDHDFTRPDLPLLRPPVTIESDAWIAADALGGPRVTVGEGALLGARGCAFGNLEPWTIYGGNPAKKLRDRPRFF